MKNAVKTAQHFFRGDRSLRKRMHKRRMFQFLKLRTGFIKRTTWHAKRKMTGYFVRC
ncbi:hypothetical protein PT2222_170198 [Paraburkholderia tropica]